MKALTLVTLAGVAIGGYFAWKYRAQLLGTVTPDPTVSTIAGNTYGGAQDVPGTITGAYSSSPSGSSSSSGGYNPLTSSPAMNSALTGALGVSSYAGGMDA